MTKLVFATNNEHKVQEIRAVAGSRFELLTLREAGILIDIPEPHDTLEANAREKSGVIYKMTGLSCFGEDTGLEVAALNGAPGVKSARYAGESRDFTANLQKLLEQLKGIEDRTAQFRTVISLILNGEEHLFEGVCKGQITRQAVGEGGFGYDPVFIPNGADQTFAVMSMAEKNSFSHRRKALDKLLAFLESVQ